jgi:hypothetical protein
MFCKMMPQSFFSHGKKLLAFVLALGLLCGGLGVNVSAEIPAATGTLDIGGQTGLSLASDINGTGWAWIADTSRLTLTGSVYTGAPIAINCAKTDDVSLVYTGNISITSAVTDAFFCNSNLTVSENGSGGTLTLGYTGSSDNLCALTVFGSLTVSGGTVAASSTATNSTDYKTAAAIYVDKNITINGSANVTANATGSDAHGIVTANSNISISTTGTVTAKSKGEGFPLFFVNYGNSQLNISGGTVNLTGKGVSNKFANITGGTVYASDGANPVYLVTLDGMNQNTIVTDVTAPAGYNFYRTRTTAAGKLCFWLPVGEQTVTLAADPYNYTCTANVAAHHANTATMTALPNNTPVSLAAIPGVTPPVTGAKPVRTVETAQYIGTLSWNDDDQFFAANTMYTADITLTPKKGYTKIGVPADFFTVSGATTVRNSAGDANYYLVVSVTFPATGSAESIYTLTVTSGTGGGTYVAGKVVTITANPAPTGKIFDKWIATSGTLTDASKASTAFTMPGSNATVTATYKDAPTDPKDPDPKNPEPPVEKKEFFKLWGKMTKWEKSPLNWFFLIVCFGWIWMAL